MRFKSNTHLYTNERLKYYFFIKIAHMVKPHNVCFTEYNIILYQGYTLIPLDLIKDGGKAAR